MKTNIVIKSLKDIHFTHSYSKQLSIFIGYLIKYFLIYLMLSSSSLKGNIYLWPKAFFVQIFEMRSKCSKQKIIFQQKYLEKYFQIVFPQPLKINQKTLLNRKLSIIPNFTQYTKHSMGNQDSKHSSNSTLSGQGIWFSYLAQIEASQMSEIIPFYNSQISYLQKVFQNLDKQNTKSIQVGEMKNLPFLRSHALKQRMVSLFEQQIRKIKAKKVSLEIFLHLLSTFHINTDIEQKVKFLFRIYDWNKDFKVSNSDLVSTFRLLFRDKIVKERLLDQEALNNMASQALVKYGTRGQIKLEQFIQLVCHDEVREIMTFRYSKNYE